MKKIGRYDIIEELGRGAMGVVYKAADPTIGRLVAIKVLTLDAPTEQGVPGAREIFMREARAAGRLSHPGIVTIHDALEDAESRSSYIVMEFIPGWTLEKVLLDEERLAPERALNIIGQIAEALDYAHRQQIIHRDLKPANILLTEDGRVKITDFGIAKIVARESAQRTVAIMGTPAYMSPEQVKGAEIDARSDLFSMGILLYLMLTGQKPFMGDTAAVMFKVVYEDPVYPSRLNSGLAPRHDYLVLRCLAKEREKRYASAREFLDDLEDVQQGLAPRAETSFPLAGLRAGEPTVLLAQAAVPTAPEKRVAKKERAKWVAIGILAGAVVALALGLGLLRFRQREAPSPSAAASPATSPPAAARAKIDAAGGPRQATPPSPAASPPAPRVAASEAAKPPAVRPSPAPLSAPPKPAPAQPRAGRVVNLVCKHEFENAALFVKSGKNTIFEARLIGNKKKGFIGIRGGYSGILSKSLKIPAGAQELTVRVYSADGAVNLLNKISAAPPSATMSTLQIVPGHQHLTLSWGEGQAVKR